MQRAHIGVVIPAAGSGQRMNQTVKKQFILLDGEPILYHTLKPFLLEEPFKELVLVCPDEERLMVQSIAERLFEETQYPGHIKVIKGGQTRQASVYNGLCALEDCSFVIVHDGVRPFVDLKTLETYWSMLKSYKGITVGTPVIDTIKRVEQQTVVETIDRAQLWAVQTPQAFDLNVLKRCHERAVSEGFLGTDDASLLEQYGEKVGIYPGHRENIKITTPFDLVVAEVLIKNKGGEDH